MDTGRTSHISTPVEDAALEVKNFLPPHFLVLVLLLLRVKILCSFFNTALTVTKVPVVAIAFSSLSRVNCAKACYFLCIYVYMCT